MGGLLPVATAENNGLMSLELYKGCASVKTIQGNGGVTKLYKVLPLVSYNLSDIYILTDIGSYIAYRVISTGNLNYDPSIENIGKKGNLDLRNLKFYKNNKQEVYMLVTSGGYGVTIFNTARISFYGVGPMLELQSSTDVSTLTEIPLSWREIGYVIDLGELTFIQKEERVFTPNDLTVNGFYYFDGDYNTAFGNNPFRYCNIIHLRNNTRGGIIQIAISNNNEYKIRTSWDGSSFFAWHTITLS